MGSILDFSFENFVTPKIIKVVYFLMLAGVALSALVPASANAMDEYLRASSSKSAPIKLCGETDADRIKTALCKEQGYDKLVAQIDKAFDAVLPKTPANIRPLLKRDQAWFNEMILEAADPSVVAAVRSRNSTEPVGAPPGAVTPAVR